jgi:coniferyl-aldehyde dehydrogenase
MAVPDLATQFAQMRAASRDTPDPALDIRKDRLLRLLSLVQTNAAAIEQSISADYGHCAVQETRIAELMPVEASIQHALRHLQGWMQPKKVPTRLVYWPGRNELRPQPFGVAGIVAPWNYPLQLLLSPAIGAIAAGNRVMLKPSEFVPAFSNLLQELVARQFAADEIVVVTGGTDVSQAFCALPFDHLLFTGSTKVGKFVAEPAARPLSPSSRGEPG